MGIVSGLKNVFNPRFSSSNSSQSSTDKNINVDDFGGARTSIPTQVNTGGMPSVLPRVAKNQLGLDETRFKTYGIFDLIDILIDAHPDVSYALWNFLRIGNSGYNISVHKLGSDEPYVQGEKVILKFIDSLKVPNPDRFEKSRSIDKLIDFMLLSVVTRGAASFEMVLTSDKSDVAFIAPVDPKTITFKFENNRFVPYQKSGSLSLDIPTFFYEGLDELIDDPYGRSPFLSALNIVLFQLQVLNDIKAVVHNQGYPRFDIMILEQVLLNRMPVSIRNNDEKKQKWLNDRLNEIISMYNSLDPDDSFVHYDSVKVDMVGGKSSGGALIDPQKLMGTIDNLVMAGLKTLSTIMGRRSQGQTESYAKMEVKLYLKSVEAIQHVVSTLMSRALTLYLNIQGKQGIVEFKFNPVDTRTELEKAQFEQIALLNYAFMRDQGWITQDEASMLAIGHKAVGEPSQRITSITNKDGKPVSGSTDTKPNP